ACIPTKGPVKRAHEPLPRLRTLLVPTDLSPAGNRAIPYAYGVLQATGGKVVLLHVLGARNPLPHFGRGETGEVAKGAVEGALSSLVPELADLHGVTTRICVVEAADPAPAILRTAQEL